MALFGFIATWSRFCLVRAVKLFVLRRDVTEIIGHGKIVIWSWLVIMWWIWSTHESPLWSQGFTLTFWPIVGGVIFGLGVRFNNACIFSTLWKLIAGQVKMLVTLCGIAIGLGGYRLVVQDFLPSVEQVTLDWSMTERDLGILLLLLCLWGIREIFKGLEDKPEKESWWIMFSSMRCWGSVMLCGIVTGGLLLSYRIWSYPMVIEQIVQGALRDGSFRWSLVLILVATVLGVGMAVFLRGIWKLDYYPRLEWIYNGVGGILIGLGIGLGLGDNLHLLAHATVSLSPHAVVVFMMMIVGIGLGLVLVPERVFLETGVKSVDTEVDESVIGLSENPSQHPQRPAKARK